MLQQWQSGPTQPSKKIILQAEPCWHAEGCQLTLSFKEWKRKCECIWKAPGVGWSLVTISSFLKLITAALKTQGQRPAQCHTVVAAWTAGDPPLPAGAFEVATGNQHLCPLYPFQGNFPSQGMLNTTRPEKDQVWETLCHFVFWCCWEDMQRKEL